MEVDGENETKNSPNLNGKGSVGGTLNEARNDLEQKTEPLDRTTESGNLHSVEKSQVEPEPELPALVMKAQKDGLQMFKLGRFAEAGEHFTQAIDILQKGEKKKAKFNVNVIFFNSGRGNCTRNSKHSRSFVWFFIGQDSAYKGHFHKFL